MANGKGGPRIPRNLKPDLEQVNSLLQDISTKISNIHQLDDAFRLKIDVEGVDDIEKLERSIAKWSTSGKAANKVQSEIIKNLRVRNSTERELNAAIDRSIKSIIKEISIEQKLSKEIQDQQDVLKLYGKEMDDLYKKTEDGQKLHKKQIKQLDELRGKYIEEKKVLEELIEKQRQAGKNVQQSQGLLQKQTEAVDKLDGKYMVLAKTIGNQVLGAIDKLGTGLATLAIDAVFFSLEKLKDGFMAIYDLLERTTKATGAFNLAMGGTTAGLDKTREEAWKVEGQLRSLTGGELGVGLQMWQETSKAIGFVGEGFDQITTKSTLAGRALGIGGQAAGELGRAFMMMGDSAKDMNKNFVEISVAAAAAGVPVADLGKEIATAKNSLAAFGKTGKSVFISSIAFAKKLGISLQSLEKFTEATDTFDSTAQAAAKMNTVFGTSINAMEMMLEQDPSKRLEMVRKQFQAQGKTWDSMNRQERKFFAQTMNLSEEEAEGMLKNNMTLEEFQKKQEKEKKKQANQEKVIRDGLAKTAQTLMNWGQQFDRITRSMMKLFNPLLQKLGLVKGKTKEGKTIFMSFGEIVGKAVGKIEQFFDKLSKNDKVMGFINEIADDIGGLLNAFLTDGPEADKAMDKIVTTVGDFASGVRDLYRVGKEIFKEVFTKENFETALKVFSFIAKNIKPIVGGFLAFKGIMGAGTVLKGINGITKELSGGKGLIKILADFGGKMGELAKTAFPTFTKALGSAGEFVKGGFSKLGNFLTQDITKISGGLGKLGAGAGVLGAAMAGWEIGKFIGDLDIAGKSINDWVVIGYEKIDEFFSSLWQAFKDSKLGSMLGLKDEAKGTLDKAGITDENISMYRSSIHAASSGGELSGKDLARLEELRKNTALLQAVVAKSTGMTEEMAFKAVQKSAGMKPTFVKKDIANTVTPPKAAVTPKNVPGAAAVSPVSPVSTAPVNAPSKDVNLAAVAKANKEAAAKGGLTLVAGDVYLDSNLVGRHLLRGAGSA